MNSFERPIVNICYVLCCSVDQSSRSPTPDTSSTHPHSSQSYTSVLHKPLATPLKGDRSQPSNPPSSVKASAARLSGHTYAKPEANSSLFSDSLDGFTTDFTLSDADGDEDVAHASSNSPRKGADPVPPCGGKGEANPSSNAKEWATPSDALPAPSIEGSKPFTNTQPTTSSRKDTSDQGSSRVGVGAAPPLPVIKQEPKTPPTALTTMHRRRGMT